MRLPPTPSELSRAAANAFDLVVRGGVADLRRTPASIVHEQKLCTVFRYRTGDERRDGSALPVLLVPPLAAPTICFDLRRGCSLAAHLTATGRPTYLVEYGHIGWSDRELGLEHWIEDVLPTAIREVSEDAGGAPVQLIGWCLGGIMSLLSVAADPSLPVRSIATVASPFDFTRVRLLKPIRPAANLTGGRLLTAVYRTLGGAPAPIVRRGFQLTSFDKVLTKPWAVLSHLDDREFLAQLEAVDHFTENMHAYPGRTFGQLYHRFFRVNDLADGHLTLDSQREIDLADVRQPVLSIAGKSDVIAPQPAVHALGDLLPGAAEVRLEAAPGGHLGVLTGRSAKGTTWRILDEFLADHGTLAPSAGGDEPHPLVPKRLRVVA